MTYCENCALLLAENTRLLERIAAVQEVCRETTDDFAPDRPPYDVTDLIERIEQALENK